MGPYGSLKFLAIAVLYLLTFSGIKFPAGGGLPPATLGVPPVAQQGSQWCWAAVSEMVMRYYHDVLDRDRPDTDKAPFYTQWELGRKRFIYLHEATPGKLKDTSNMPRDPKLIQGSVFDNQGFPYFYPYYSQVWVPNILSWEALCDTFTSRHPIIFMWAAKRRDTAKFVNHYMIAEGCSSTPGILSSSGTPKYQWVSIIDPWPLDDASGKSIARHAQISYEDYRRSNRGSLLGVKKDWFWQKAVYNWVITRKEPKK